MTQSLPNWEVYERMIARICADQLSTDFCVSPNARLIGRISGRSRQIDVLIDSRHDTDNSLRIIMDAKQRKRKIDVKDVEAFHGLMEDVGATHGYLVCPVGHTKAAEKRAQNTVSISLIPLDCLDNFDPTTWPKCTDTRCKQGRIFWDGYPEINLILRPLTGLDEFKEVSFIHYIGKCDRCGAFHVKCLTCEELLSPKYNDDNDIGHQCRCKLPWFWLASIESDEEGRKSAELHAVLGVDKVITVDRRSLS